ncbi:DUF1622 domain-containing protein [Jatrophihabitans sp. YIM 134969]
MVTVVEACGAAVIAVGAAWAFIRFLVTAAGKRRTEAFVPIRLTLGRFLALGLELQLAGDVLRTAVAPSFHEIGQLAAVAAIRTALNFFLAREIREERAQVDADHARARQTDAHRGPAGSTTPSYEVPGTTATTL